MTQSDEPLSEHAARAVSGADMRLMLWHLGISISDGGSESSLLPIYGSQVMRSSVSYEDVADFVSTLILIGRTCQIEFHLGMKMTGKVAPSSGYLR